MTLALKTMRPRNPFATAARLRQAGSHRPSGGARRQQAATALRREIERLRPSP